MKRLTLVRVAISIVVVAVAVLYPIYFGTGGNTAMLEQVFAYGAFAMSYDLLIGYTGIVSFGHAMFFGTGAYVISVFLSKGNGSSLSLWEGIGTAGVVSVLLSLGVAFLSLRIRDTYFAMITLAVGQTFFVLAGSQALRGWTNANDGITVPVPDWLNSDETIYYVGLAFLIIAVLVLRRFVHSPIGTALKGIRENEPRMAALGHSVFRLKTTAFVLSGLVATFAGAVYAVAQMFVSTQVYDVSTSLNVLLMTIIGGIGTLYGGVLGAFVILFAEAEFSNLAGVYPVFNQYMIIFGVLYIVTVRFMPKGVVGTLLEWKGRTRCKTYEPDSNKFPI